MVYYCSAVYTPSRHALTAAEATFSAAQSEFGKADTLRQTAEDRCAAAEAAYDAARDKEKAAALRLTLTPGCLCPVCEQPVDHIPDAEAPRDVQSAQRLFEAAKKASDAAVCGANGARDKVNRTEADLANCRKRRQDWVLDAQRIHLQFEDASRRLAAAIQPFESKNFADDLKAQENLHAKWLSLDRELKQAELQAHTAESKAALAESALAARRLQKLGVETGIQEAEKNLAGYDLQIGSVASDDPASEQRTLAEEIRQIEEDLAKARSDRDSASAAKAQAELKATESRARAEAAGEERDQSERAANESLRASGFEAAADAKRASLTPEKRKAGEDEVKQFDAAYEQTVRVLATWTCSSTASTSPRATCCRPRQKQKRQRRRPVALAQSIGASENELKSLREATAKAELLRSEHGARRARHAIFDQLSKDLRGDCFQQYLLEG